MDLPFFFYGSLMHPRTVNHVLRRGDVAVTRTPATLGDYHRFRLKRRTYPALVAKQGATVEGVLMAGFTQVDGRALGSPPLAPDVTSLIGPLGAMYM